MSGRGRLVGLAFCTCYLVAQLTNKYILSVLKFTCPTLFQGWQTLVGGLLLHVSWKLVWVEINSSSRSDVLAWLSASVLFVGIIYAGSRGLSRLDIPVFLTLHNAAEVIVCGHRMCFRKEKTPPAKICSALLLLAAAGSLPFNDAQFDPDGYFWAVIHLLIVGACKNLQTSLKPRALSDIDQQYLNYIFSVVLLAATAHPTGDLRALDFPFLYVYRFHGSCCASGLLGFLVTLSTVKLKSLVAPGQCVAWLLLAQVATAGSSVLLLFEGVLTRETLGCVLLGGLGEAWLVFSERRGPRDDEVRMERETGRLAWEQMPRWSSEEGEEAEHRWGPLPLRQELSGLWLQRMERYLFLERLA